VNSCHCEERSDEAIPTPVGIASPSARNDSLVIGVGNPIRGEDNIGRVVVDLLRSRKPVNVRLVERDGEAMTLLADLQCAGHAWLIDAAQSGAPAGTFHRIDCAMSDAVVPRGSVSSHGFGVAEAIELARALGTLPVHCIVYAIEATDFTPGAVMSPAVTRAAHEVADRILAELATPPPSTRRLPHRVPATDRR
jgi:hydrogenase maturation protease